MTCYFRKDPQVPLILERDWISVDLYAGGGGASTGMEAFFGHAVDVAINHDPGAISMHTVNHPHTTHHCENILEVDPLQVAMGRKVKYLWLSPDCTHHSKARGGTPVKKEIRGLAWQAVKWAGRLKKHNLHPDQIYLENVSEFLDWGPVIAKRDRSTGKVKYDANGNMEMVADRRKGKKGRIFRRFVKELNKLGYVVDWRVMNSADYGAHTGRPRLFLIARNDGLPITFPEQTHIHRTKVKSSGLKAYSPAYEKIDFSIPTTSIFLNKDQVKDMGLRVRRPLADKTLQRIFRGVDRFVLNNPEPFIIRLGHYSTNNTARSLQDPLSTITSKNEHMLVMPIISKHYRGATASDLRDPFPTITARGTQNQLTTVHLSRDFGQSIGSDVRDPVGVITPGGQGKTGIVACNLMSMRNNCVGSDLRDPAPVITAGGNHAALVAAFLMKYTNTGVSLHDPIQTITTREHFALVTVEIDGERYVITDIGIRMLTPRELFSLQGFPDDYEIEFDHKGNPITATVAVGRCGNSVVPLMPQLLLSANNPTYRKEAIAA